jgi:hypothetical protein
MYGVAAAAIATNRVSDFIPASTGSLAVILNGENHRSCPSSSRAAEYSCSVMRQRDIGRLSGCHFLRCIDRMPIP